MEWFVYLRAIVGTDERQSIENLKEWKAALKSYISRSFVPSSTRRKGAMIESDRGIPAVRSYAYLKGAWRTTTARGFLAGVLSAPTPPSHFKSEVMKSA